MQTMHHHHRSRRGEEERLLLSFVPVENDLGADRGDEEINLDDLIRAMSAPGAEFRAEEF